MAEVVLLHGSGKGPGVWLPWLKSELEKKGKSVWMPTLPESENPNLELQLQFLNETKEITPDSLVIGHSAACPLILAYLEQQGKSVKKTILVSGFYAPLPSHTEFPAILKHDYDTETIKAHCGGFVFINSENDPWGCTDTLAYNIAQKLKATLVVPFGEGHMGSETFNQPYTEFPLLLSLI